MAPSPPPPLFAAAVVVLLAHAAIAAPYFLEIHVLPAIPEYDYHEYRFEVRCPGIGFQTALFAKRGRPDESKFVVRVDDEHQKCPVGYQVLVAVLFNEGKKLHEDEKFKPWNMPLETTSMPLGDRDQIKHEIRLVNHFDLTVLPNLDANARHNMIYRVDVSCAGHAETEFSTYTYSETRIVLNSAGTPKCARRSGGDPEYDVRVWPIRKEWLDKENVFGQPELVVSAVAIKNEDNFEIKFPAYFYLDITPALLPDSVYYVRLMQHHANAQQQQRVLFRTYTDENAQILMAEPPDGTAFDIFVNEINEDKTIGASFRAMRNKNRNGGLIDEAKIFGINAQNERKKLGVKIEDRTTQTFDFNAAEEEEEQEQDQLAMDIDEEQQKQQNEANMTDIAVAEPNLMPKPPSSSDVARKSRKFEEIKEQLATMRTGMGELKNEMNFLREEMSMLSEFLNLKLRRE